MIKLYIKRNIKVYVDHHKLSTNTREKLLRKIYKSAVFLTTTCFLTFGYFVGYAQIDKKININRNLTDIKAVFTQLEKLANLNFIYSDLGGELQKKVNIGTGNTSAKNYLKRIEQQSNLQFTFNGNDIVVKLIKKEIERKELYAIIGKVIDTENRPVVLANITVLETGISTYSDINGNFNIPILRRLASDIALRITAVGKKQLTDAILKKDFNTQKTFVLEELSLQLKEVEIIAQQKIEQSNSSVMINRQTIENTQAFSLADILASLPGKILTAPQLASPQQLTLRTDASGNHLTTNSLGVGIIVDGLAVSNDANMQNLNIGNKGMTGSIISDRTYGAFDVPFGGIDLREIPADNIESIEVISGVAPAQYDNITDGAVIINRQAGRTDYQFTTRVNSSSSNFSLSKGYNLDGKAGALNMSINYLHSAVDPRDNVKTLNRVSGSLMWTKRFGKYFKNTISIDGNERLDRVKTDPDDPLRLKTTSINRNFSISERASLQLNGNFFRKLDFTAGASYGYQNSSTEWFLNQGVVPITYKDTTNAIYEGSFLFVNYTSLEQVIGKPLSVRANASTIGLASTGNITHAISFGGSFSYSDNLGEGIIADPNRPRWYNGSAGEGNNNDRPYDYSKMVPALVNFGFYVNDRFKLKFLERTLSVNAGLRYDLQNGYGTIQPRINTAYSIAQNLQLTLAYGIATKAPTLAHRYPAPTYFDIPLISQTGAGGVVDVSKSLYLVYTERYTPDNSHLKPSRSDQFEAGLRYNKGGFSSSIFVYHKKNSDGFTTNSTYRQFSLPVYVASLDSDGKIIYSPNGTMSLKASLSQNTAENALKSENSGAEWFISLPKIKEIQTSFSIVNSFSYSYFQNNLQRIVPANATQITAGGKAWYGVYSALNYENWTLRSKLNSTTHIAPLGFYVNFNLDISWDRRTHNIGAYTIPTAWLDKDLNEHPITNFDPKNKDYGYLQLINTNETEGKQPFAYANLSMQIAKEIKNRIRFSLNAYNMLNTRVSYYNPATTSFTYFNNPISVAAQLSVKF